MKEFVNVFPTIVVVPCRVTQVVDVRVWLLNNDIKHKFRNHWQDEQGQFLSVDIPDDADRLMFKLRWS